MKTSVRTPIYPNTNFRAEDQIVLAILLGNANLRRPVVSNLAVDSSRSSYAGGIKVFYSRFDTIGHSPYDHVRGRTCVCMHMRHIKCESQYFALFNKGLYS